MNTQHTPGPWKACAPIGPGDFGILSMAVNAGGNFYVATIPNGQHREAEATARLIAAAPELLAALESCLAHLQDEYNSSKHHGHKTNAAAAFIASRAAIAKAKGE